MIYDTGIWPKLEAICKLRVFMCGGIHKVLESDEKKCPNRDKKTESPYLVHPLTYRQVYLTKDAYFVEKIHCELVKWL